MLGLAYPPVGPESTADEIILWIADLVELYKTRGEQSDAIAGMVEFRLKQAWEWLLRAREREAA